jgi:SlyX protein
MNERIEQFEVKVAFLEQANSQLSEEVFRLRKELETLETRLHTLTGRFEAALVTPTAYTAEDEKPPHY